MKINAFITSMVAASLLFVSCKKDQESDRENVAGDATVSVLYERPVSEDASYIMASTDARIIATLRQLSTNDCRVYFTKNGGQIWEDMVLALSPQNDVRITTGGYVYFSRGNTRRLVNLNNKQEVTINYFATLNQEEDFFVGSDDYIYTNRFFNRISESRWDTMPITGRYCGQDVTNGGAAFYDLSAKKLHVHNPKTNTAISFDITIDETKVSLGMAQPNRPPRYVYNGSNMFLIAYTKGFAIQNLDNGTVTYTDWDEGYTGQYLNPVSISVEKDGTIYAKLTSHSNTDMNFRYKNDEKNTFFSSSPVVSINQYSYYVDGLKVNKVGSGIRERFYTSYQNIPNANRASIVSFLENNGQSLSLLQIPISSATPITLLHEYNKSTKDFTPINRVNGNYSFVYSDNGRIYVYGKDSTAYSSDNGRNWEVVKSNFDAVTNEKLKQILKVGSTYYAVWQISGTCPGSIADLCHSVTTYSSSDGLNWTLVGSVKQQNGQVGKAMTFKGELYARHEVQTFGQAIAFERHTKDFGKTWGAESGGLTKIDLVKNENEIYAIRLGASNSIVITQFDGAHQKVSERTSVLSGNSSTYLGFSEGYFDNSGKLYAHDESKVYTLN